MPQVDKPHERKTEAMDERHIIHQKDDQSHAEAVRNARKRHGCRGGSAVAAESRWTSS